MILNETTVVDVLKNPKSTSKINSVKKQESQLRVFTEDLSEHEIKNEPYWNEFLTKMKTRSEKKFDRVIQFARFPLPVVQISDSILNDFYKVFEGKNKFFDVDGDRDVPRLKEWINKYKPSKWVQKEAMGVFKNKPCSFVVVDKKDDGTPYLINVGSERLVDAEIIDSNGNCGMINFIHSQKKHETKVDVITTFYSVYDEESYFVYSKDSDSDTFTKVSSRKHGIGYCPAKTFIKTSTSTSNQFKRRVAFSSALSKLEDWTLFDIFRNFVDHYAPFPVTEAPKNKCANDQCKDGKVSTEVVDNTHPDGGRTVWSDCPVCKGVSDGQNIFPGTHIGIKVNPDNKNNGQGVFRMIFPDTDKLKYTPEKLDKLELETRFKCVGVNDLSNEAFNELQVKGSFATMESVLLRTKSELDDIYKFIVLTVGKILYKNVNLTVEANFGTEFYLVSEDDLQKRYKEAKEIGLPVEEQLNIYKQLVETKYKGNATKLNRNLMLLDLDPFPMNSHEECFKLKSESVIDDYELSLKVNFLKFISKFENENVPITQFGLSLEYWQRIEAIRKTLEIYNQELIDRKMERNNPGSNDGGENEPIVTQEQLDAQANLRGSVGGVQGILGIQESVKLGTTTPESAIATLIEIYGFNRDTAIKILGTNEKNPSPSTTENVDDVEDGE